MISKPKKKVSKRSIKKKVTKLVKKKPVRNPYDKEFIDKIKIKRLRRGDELIYRAYYLGNDYIGEIQLFEGDDYVTLADISPSFRRKGLATFMYDYIENDLGIKLKPSKLQTINHEKFWKNRLK